MGSSRNENPADSDHRDRGEREREWNELAAIYPPARFRFLGRYYRDATRLQRAPSVSSPFLNRAVSSDIRSHPWMQRQRRGRPSCKISRSIFVSFRIDFENPRSLSMRRII